MTDQTEIKENTKIHFCECCQYQTVKKYNYSKHLLTKKHVKKSTEPLTEPLCIELKIKKQKNVKPLMVEMSTQTDSETETVVCGFDESDDLVIELENKNYELENKIDELTYELKEKNDEIKNLVVSIEKQECDIQIDIETKNELIIELKGQIQDLKEEFEEKIKAKDLIIQRLSKQENIEIIKQPIENVKPSKLKKIVHENNYLTEENYNNLLKENELLTNDCIRLEEELENIKLKIVEEDVKVINNERKELPIKKSSQKQKSSSSKNPMEIYKELCSNPKFNNKITNHSVIDRCNGNSIATTKVLKSIRGEDYSEKPTSLYKNIMSEIIDEMKSKDIKFIKCVDTKRKVFKIHDGNEWKKCNDREFDNIIVALTSYINSSIQCCIANTSNLDDLEFKKLYGIQKDLYHDSEKGTKQSIFLSTFNPIYDESINYMKTIKVLCSSLFKIENKNRSNKRRSNKSYDSDSDNENNSDSEIEEDD